MSYPTDLSYTKDHEWISFEGETKAKIGVTAYAVEQLGDIVHLELPDVGGEFKEGDAFGTIESTKTVSDLYIPLTGKVVAINEAFVKDPQNLQDADNGKAWLVEIEFTAKGSELLTANDYEKYISE